MTEGINTDEQKMIYEVLKESSKPIMAKKIARNIYHKYNGYRMSRFMVRDILWKEMRNVFEYDQYDYTYRLKDTKNDSFSSELNYVQEQDKISLIKNQLKERVAHEVLSEFKSFFKANYLGVNSGNNRFDDLIKLVVKDNIITPNEEAFLIEKSREYGLTPEIVNTVRKHVHSNNPYLDNLIHLIFEDGIISENELGFLKEKETENNYSKSFVNHRFWQIGICFYIKVLIKNEDFLKLIKTWEIGRALDFDLVNSDVWMILNLDIHKSNSIEEIIRTGLASLQHRLLNHLKTNLDLDSSVLHSLMDTINLEVEQWDDEKLNDKVLSLDQLISILYEEKRRIGDPAADLLVENILFRLEH